MNEYSNERDNVVTTAAAATVGAGAGGPAAGPRLVLLGDLHLFQLAVAPWRLLGKRLLGQANLWLRRRRRFDHSLLPAFTTRISALRPDWMLLSGDLTTTSLVEEFKRATAWLHCGPIAGMSKIVVPGNHDRYTFSAHWRQTPERWLGEWMPQRFPGWRRLSEGWAVLSLDAARPRLLSSRGEVSARQAHDAADLLEAMPAGTGLIVLCHYPFAVPAPIVWHRNHRLAHPERVEALLARAAERAAQVLYFHGHLHQPWVWRPELSNGKRITVVNAGAPCCIGRDHPDGQGFWQIDLPGDPAEPVHLQRHVPVRSRKGLAWTRVPAAALDAGSGAGQAAIMAGHATDHA